MFNVPTADVSTETVLPVLQPIWLSKPETASRVRGRIERVLDAAKVKGSASARTRPAAEGTSFSFPNAARPKSGTTPHSRSLRSPSSWASCACEMQSLLGLSSLPFYGGLLRRSAWNDWEEVDLAAAARTVPGDRMKAGVTSSGAAKRARCGGPRSDQWAS